LWQDSGNILTPTTQEINNVAFFRLPLLLERSFAQWLRQQDLRFLVDAATLRSWLQALVFVILLLLLLTQIQTIHAFMGLSFWTALLCFFPAFLVGSLIHFQKSIPPPRVAVYTLGTSGGVFFFCMSLMVLAKPTAGMLFGIFYLFAVAFYGWLLRARPQTPFPLFSLWLGTLGAWWFNQNGFFWIFAAFLLPISTPVMFWFGGWACQSDLRRREHENLRETLFTQNRLEQSAQVETMRRSLTQILSYIHDLNNQLQPIVSGAYILQDSSIQENLPEQAREVLHDLDGAVRRVVDISRVLHSGRVGEDERAHALIHTEVCGVIQKVVERVQRIYPNVQIHSALPSAVLSLPISGGETTLSRIVENLLLNACQGQDGRSGAMHVWLRLRYDATQQELVLEVEDDGVGLPSYLIEQGPSLMVSTKGDAGTGLGLYNVSLLARTNGGELCLANRPEGGALISVSMRFPSES